MSKLITEEQVRIYIGDIVCKTHNTDYISSRTQWKVEAVKTAKTDHIYDISVWCPFTNSWASIHYDIDTVIRNGYVIYRKTEDNKWEEV